MLDARHSGITEGRIMIGTNPRFIFGYLLLLGIVAVGVILSSVFWLTSRLDKLEQQGVENVVELMVTEKVERVKVSTADYAHWNLAYELVIANDKDGLYDNLGSGATESDLFDQIVILNSKGKVVHVYDSTGSLGSPEDFDLEGILPFLARLKETIPADYVTVSGIGTVDGVYGAIAATRITPDYLENSESAPLPVMLGIKLFNEDALQAIARLTQGTGYAITPVGDPPADPAIELAGPDGTPVAQLIWTHNQVGTALRTEIMPALLLVCVSIFGICLFAARYFHQQSKALDRAMMVASTDKLTGLLNRSGLDEALRAPKVKARIDAGHVAIIYLDLNGFKQLNDEHGHDDGDQALRITAERLRDAVRPQDLVVRLGGDEFICMVFDRAPGAAARAVSDRILINHVGPIRFAHHEKVVTSSLGVALGEPGLAWEVLMSRADQAMYQAKRGKLTVAVFHEADDMANAQAGKHGAPIAA
ncbi:diguanylate cyclase [Hoeflea sp.]|uniref:diguanylate cyclase domain-containing protein n=2 Tax=Hoeflea sp. TaxID=1940281 RepID=UPI0025BF6C6D|nr:diguanylate cyclase [Hoeflea sp.]MBU4548743.1 diguanylate cyclase [Alphaproteobacteria bacterium]MBV1781640.1 diguanylate cyclase [Hoeflea sp.]